MSTNNNSTLSTIPVTYLRINPKKFNVRKPKWSKDFLVRCVVCSNRTIVSLMRAKELIENDKKVFLADKNLDDVEEDGSGAEDQHEYEAEVEEYERFVVVKCSYCAKPARVTVTDLMEGIAEVEARKASE